MVKIREWLNGPSWIYYFLKPLSNLMLPLLDKGQIAPEFHKGSKLLQPIIISHGLGLSRSHYVVLSRELASYGFIVFVLNHNDRSCELTTSQFVKVASPDGDEPTEKREVIEFDDFYAEDDTDIREAQATMRENELMSFIDQIKCKSFLSETLGEAFS